MNTENTQVCIVGAGPSGLLLSHLLHLNGINSIVIEAATRQKVEARVRAGVLDQNTVDLLTRCGLSKRMEREGAKHRGFDLLFDRRRHRIDVAELAGGRSVMLYPQQELVKDLIEARLASRGQIIFGVSDVHLSDLQSAQPHVTFVKDDRNIDIVCDFVIGCDGFHGICRRAIPPAVRVEHLREYPFAWLGILCEAPPSSPELVYAAHEAGFALVSTRSPTIQRMYLQCDRDATPEQWPDERIWEEFDRRLQNADGWSIRKGPILQKDVVSMRSFVCETMHYGRLFLAGDAAHIVPPSAAKGLNLAASDVASLAEALSDFYRSGSFRLLAEYPTNALKRFWRAEYFSWWVTMLMHRYPDADAFDLRQQQAALNYLIYSRAAAESFAENYVGITN